MTDQASIDAPDDESIAARPLHRSSATGVTAVGIVVIGVTLWWTIGLTGLGVGLVLGLASIFLSAPYLVAVVFVAASALTGEIARIELLGLGIGSAIVLSSTVWHVERATIVRIVGAGLLAVGGLAGAYYFGMLVTEALVWGVLTATGAFAVGAYGLYRYGIVQQLREVPR